MATLRQRQHQDAVAGEDVVVVNGEDAEASLAHRQALFKAEAAKMRERLTGMDMSEDNLRKLRGDPPLPQTDFLTVTIGKICILCIPVFWMLCQVCPWGSCLSDVFEE